MMRAEFTNSAPGDLKEDDNDKPPRPRNPSSSGIPPSSLDDDDEDGGRSRRKIEIKFIQDKGRRHITFSKRRHGIMKKAWELSMLTGTQVLLLVVSETGLVYTYSTPKLQPMVTQAEGKRLIQDCLNAPDLPLDEEQKEVTSIAAAAGGASGSSSSNANNQHGANQSASNPVVPAPVVAPMGGGAAPMQRAAMPMHRIPVPMQPMMPTSPGQVPPGQYMHNLEAQAAMLGQDGMPHPEGYMPEYGYPHSHPRYTL